MAKAKKRSRQFDRKGGAKGMIEKGTITKKGKVKLKKRRQTNGDNEGGDSTTRLAEANFENKREEERREKVENDFVGESNLGDLDLDDFLKSVVDGDDDEDDEESKVDNDMNDDDVMDDDSSSEDESEADEGSDEEDIKAAEERMTKEMSKLAESDPDFHKYLEENESSLLDFRDDIDVDNNADGDSEDDEMETESIEDDRRSNKDQDDENLDSIVQIDAKVLSTYERSAFDSHGIKGLKRMILAYRSTCHLSDSDEDKDAAGGRKGQKVYKIESPIVANRLMVVCLTRCHEEFRHHLLGKGASSGDDDESDKSDDFDENTPINPKRQLAKSIRWTQLKPSINTFIRATLHLLNEAKESRLLTFVLKSLSRYVPYLSAFPHLAKALLKTTTSLWSSTNDSSSDYQGVRLNAFLRIRQLALTQPFPFIESCLKSTYLSYAKLSKFANESLLPSLTFMGNCVVELYSLDYASSYQHAFVYIRQLALHLRTALQKKTPEAFSVVYCWQYIHCLKLWSSVLASSCIGPASEGGSGDEEGQLMRSLVYPLTEIIFGVTRLIPTCRYLPLRLHCVRLLQQLAASSTFFIPTTSILLEVFDLKEISMNPKRVQKRGTDVRGLRLPLILKLPKQDTLRTAEQLDACLGEVFTLLNREIDLYRYSAGFPEFSVRICQRLRKVITIFFEIFVIEHVYHNISS